MARLIVAVEILADGEGRERDGDRRDERIPVRVADADADGVRAAGVALVEDDHAARPGGFGVLDLDAKVARASLDQRDMAGGEPAEVGAGAAARRTGGRRRRDDDAARRLNRRRRRPRALSRGPVAVEEEASWRRRDLAQRRDRRVGVVEE